MIGQIKANKMVPRMGVPDDYKLRWVNKRMKNIWKRSTFHTGIIIIEKKSLFTNGNSSIFNIFVRLALHLSLSVETYRYSPRNA